MLPALRRPPGQKQRPPTQILPRRRDGIADSYPPRNHRSAQCQRRVLLPGVPCLSHRNRSSFYPLSDIGTRNLVIKPTRLNSSLSEHKLFGIFHQNAIYFCGQTFKAMELLGRQRRRASSSTCNPRSMANLLSVPRLNAVRKHPGPIAQPCAGTSPTPGNGSGSPDLVLTADSRTRDSNCSMCPFRMRCSPRSRWRNYRPSGSTPGSPLRRNSHYTCRPRCPRWWYLVRNRSRRGCRNAWCTWRHPDSTLLAGHRSSPHLLCTPIRQYPLPTYCNRPAAAGTTNTDRRSTIHSEGSHFFSFSSFPLFWVNGTIT